MKCDKCGSKNIIKSGFKPRIGGKVQRYECKDCCHTFTEKRAEIVLYKPAVPNPQFRICEKKEAYKTQ